MNIFTINKNISFYTKIFISFFIGGLLLFSANTASAVWGMGDMTTDPAVAGTTGATTGTTGGTLGVKVAEFAKTLFQEVIKGIVKTLLNKLTEATVNWINGGFEGNPQFVSNPKSFFTDIGNTQVKSFVDLVGYDDGKFPYGRQVAKTLINNYVYEKGSFEKKAKFTLDTVIGSDWKNFQTDFKVGGWEGYQEFVQNPSNNPFGALFQGLEEVNKTKEKAKGIVQKELDKGQGFLDQKVCTKTRTGPQVGGTYGPQTQAESQQFQGPYAPPPDQSGGNVNETLTGTSDKDCLEYKTLSPGSVVQTQLNRAMGSKFANAELGQALGSSISAIVNALTNTLVSKGLSALSTAISGDDESTSQQDDWQYEGLTLSGPVNATDTSNPSDWANGPDKVYNLEELLITGIPTKTKVVIKINPETGIPEQQFEPTEFGKTVLELTKEEKDLYKEITTKLTQLPNKLWLLDQCIPGPDYKWNDRFSQAVSRATKKLQGKAAKAKEKNAEKAERALRYVEGATQGVGREIQTKILENNIPHYIDMTDQITRTGRYSIKAKNYFDKLITLTGAAARLESIKRRYLELNYDPNAETISQETQNKLKDLIREYASLERDISSSDTVTRAHNDLDTINEDIALIESYLDPTNPQSCPAEKRNPNNQVLFTMVTKPGGLIGFIQRATQQLVSDLGIDYVNEQLGLNNLNNGISSVINLPNNTKLYSAFGANAVSDLSFDAAPPPGLEGVVIITTVGSEQMIQELRTTYGLDDDTEDVLREKDSEALAYIYSVVVGNAVSNKLPGQTGLTLIQGAIDLVDGLTGETASVAFALNGEQAFYCQQELDKIDLENVYKSVDVKLKCDSFFHSSPYDYEIDKSY